MRTQGNTRWTAGSIHPKPRDSLAYLHMKGYRPTWAVDQATDSLKKMGGREKGAPTARTEASAAGRHCRLREARRRAWNKAYGPRFDEPKASTERGDNDELTTGEELRRHRDDGDGNGGAGAADPVALWRGGCCFFVHGQTRKRERGDNRGAVTGSGPHLKRLGSRASRPRREVDHCGGCCLERAQERDARRWRMGLTRGAERSETDGRRRARRQLPARLGRPRKVTGEGKEKARGPAVELGQPGRREKNGQQAELRKRKGGKIFPLSFSKSISKLIFKRFLKPFSI